MPVDNTLVNLKWKKTHPDDELTGSWHDTKRFILVLKTIFLILFFPDILEKTRNVFQF